MSIWMLKLQNLGRQIQGQWIWRHLDFELQAGERCAVAGEAGAGKTLLLRAIASSKGNAYRIGPHLSIGRKCFTYTSVRLY
jgi:ABC-type transport system involved in cytochrome c biogenesis ATPase subunit